MAKDDFVFAFWQECALYGMSFVMAVVNRERRQNLKVGVRIQFCGCHSIPFKSLSRILLVAMMIGAIDAIGDP